MKTLLQYSWKDIDALPKDKTIFFLTIAPIEEHSLHLPLGVDIIQGKYWEKKTIDQLKKQYPDYHFIPMPFIPLAVGCMPGFPGCIYVKPRLLRKIVTNVLSAISSWGIKNLIIIASHGDPFHNMAIEKACDKINRQKHTNFISPMGCFFSSDYLDLDLIDETDLKEMTKKLPNDFHAGWVETSMMLDISPDLVQDFVSLPDVIVHEKEMISPKKYSTKTRGYGHLGYPQHACPDLGKKLNHSTVKFIVDVAEKLINGDDLTLFKHHFLYNIFPLRFMV